MVQGITQPICLPMRDVTALLAQIYLSIQLTQVQSTHRSVKAVHTFYQTDKPLTLPEIMQPLFKQFRDVIVPSSPTWLFIHTLNN